MNHSQQGIFMSSDTLNFDLKCCSNPLSPSSQYHVTYCMGFELMHEGPDKDT